MYAQENNIYRGAGVTHDINMKTVSINNYKIKVRWVNGTEHWTIVISKMSLDELWKRHKRTCELMGMKLIAITNI